MTKRDTTRRSVGTRRGDAARPTEVDASRDDAARPTEVDASRDDAARPTEVDASRDDAARPTEVDASRDDAARLSPAFFSRYERFRSVPSTNDVVRSWMTEGTTEVCLAVADEQTAGRGRMGRTWIAPSGAALMLSLGFLPGYLPPDRLWRLPAVVALAMADAAEEMAGLPIGMLRFKWPNDIVVAADAGVRKVAGVLSESEGVGTPAVRAVVGIGVNADWRSEDFPPDLAGSMTSLREASRGRPIDSDQLLAAFLLRLEPRVLALREGHFDVAGWHDRQVTTGRMVRIDMPDGSAQEVRAVGVDGASGALLVEDAAAPGGERELLVGEVAHVRLGPAERGATQGAPVSGGRGVTN